MPARGDARSTDTTLGGLANRMQCSVRAITAWKKLPGAPSDYNYDKWIAFRDAQGLGVPGNRIRGDREKLLCERLRVNIDIEKIELEKARNEVVSISDVNTLLLRIATEQKLSLLQKMVNELPPKCDGLLVAESRAIHRQCFDEICDIFSGHMTAWLTEHKASDPLK